MTLTSAAGMAQGPDPALHSDWSQKPV